MDKNKYLQPQDSLIAQERPEISLEFDNKSERGMVKRFHMKGLSLSTDDIATGAITGAKLATGAVSNTKINSFDWSKGTGGTISNATINTAYMTSGTIYQTNVDNSTIGTPMINNGTIVFARIGTSIISGGTVDPTYYKIRGTAGATGTITALGTIIVQQGLIVSIS